MAVRKGGRKYRDPKTGKITIEKPDQPKNIKESQKVKKDEDK